MNTSNKMIGNKVGRQEDLEDNPVIIKKACNSFMIYCKENRKSIMQSEKDPRLATKLLSDNWRKLENEDKLIYFEKADQEKMFQSELKENEDPNEARRISRPPTCFIVFRINCSNVLKKEGFKGNINKEIVKRWKNLTPEELETWDTVYQLQMTKYKFEKLDLNN